MMPVLLADGGATTTVMDTILGYLTTFATSLLSIWTSVIKFIMTADNAICLIPLIAWLFVLGISSVRGMYKG